MMDVNLNLPNGKHVIYFATSCPADGSYGTYSGGVQMDGIGGEFSSVDVDTVAAFEIEVKDNKAIKRVNQASQDIIGTSGPGSNKVKVVANKIKAYAQKNTKWLIVAVGASGAVGVTAYFLAKRQRSRRL
jgi:hypothetical protein